MTTDEKLKNIIDALDVQVKQLSSKCRFLSEHKFNREFEHVNTKRKIISEIRSEIELVRTDIRKDGQPIFEFENL